MKHWPHVKPADCRGTDCMYCLVKEGLRDTMLGPWFPFHAEMSVIGLNAELNQLEILLISFFKCPVEVVPLGGGWLRGLLFHGWFGLHVELAFEPHEINFWNNWLKKRNQTWLLFSLNFSRMRCCKNEKR